MVVFLNNKHIFAFILYIYSVIQNLFLFLHRINTNIYIAMITSNALMQGVYLDIPVKDWKFFKELVTKMGWNVRTKEELLDSFISSRNDISPLTDEEIINELHAVRQTK